jgi:DNA-binding NtrC family response regulator
MGTLKRALEEQWVETHSAKSCHEANLILSGQQPPHLVLVAPRLPDGSWQDIVFMATTAPAPVNVIVVSEVVDIAFYLEAIHVGAFDFIVPPLSGGEFAYLVNSAIDNVLRRRGLDVLRAKSMGCEGGTGPVLGEPRLRTAT